MSKKESSLDRLSKLSNPDDNNLFEDTDESISTDDYLDSMSDMAKSKFGTLIQEVSLDEPIVEEKIEEPEVDIETDSSGIVDVLDDYSTETDESTEDIEVSEVSSTVDEPHNVETVSTEQIKIDVEDTGVDMPLEESTKDESLFNNKPKRSRGRRSKNNDAPIVKETKSVEVPTAVENTSSIDLILSQLSKDIIDDLRKQNYRIGRFDDKSMEVIYSYMYKKF